MSIVLVSGMELSLGEGEFESSRSGFVLEFLSLSEVVLALVEPSIAFFWTSLLSWLERRLS